MEGVREWDGEGAADVLGLVWREEAVEAVVEWDGVSSPVIGLYTGRDGVIEAIMRMNQLG